MKEITAADGDRVVVETASGGDCEGKGGAVLGC